MLQIFQSLISHHCMSVPLSTLLSFISTSLFTLLAVNEKKKKRKPALAVTQRTTARHCSAGTGVQFQLEVISQYYPHLSLSQTFPVNVSHSFTIKKMKKRLKNFKKEESYESIKGAKRVGSHIHLKQWSPETNCEAFPMYALFSKC